MFSPKTERIEKLSEIFSKRTKELEGLFSDRTVIYIDWANALHWQRKFEWHIHLGRMKQLFDSFDTVGKVRLYTGTLSGNEKSEESNLEAVGQGYEVSTKPVKHMRLNIDTTSISEDSPDLLRDFIKKSLLSKLDLESVSFLNGKLKEMNAKGIRFLEEQKCNFDVEIGQDMFTDLNSGEFDTFILMSGDSDFQSSLQHLLDNDKKVVIFATSGKVSTELHELGVPIFDIKKIRELICWPREIDQSIKAKL